MLEWLLTAIQTKNIPLLNFLLSVFPYERWFDIDGNGSSVAHYICATDIPVMGLWMVNAAQQDHENKSGFTPAMIAELRLKHLQAGTVFDPASCGLKDVAIKTLAEVVAEKISPIVAQSPIKMFYSNIKVIIETEKVTENQCTLLQTICDRTVDLAQKNQLTQLLVRMLMLCGDYAKAKKLIEQTPQQDEMAEANKRIMLFALRLITYMEAAPAEGIRRVILNGLPHEIDNSAIAVLLLNNLKVKQISQVYFDYIDAELRRMKVSTIPQIGTGYIIGNISRKEALETLNKITLFFDVFFFIQENKQIALLRPEIRVTKEDWQELKRLQAMPISLLGAKAALSAVLFSDSFYEEHNQKILDEETKLIREMSDENEKVMEKMDAATAQQMPSATAPQAAPSTEEAEARIEWKRFNPFNTKTVADEALLWAIRHNHISMMGKLFAIVDEEFITSGIGGASIFHFIATDGTREAMECLVSIKPEMAEKLLAAPDREGRTPQHYASMVNNQSLLSFFDARGMVEIVMSPIERAVVTGDLAAVKALYEGALMPDNMGVLHLLKWAILARKSHLFAYFVPKLTSAQHEKYGNKILSLMTDCFGANARQAVKEFVLQVPDSYRLTYIFLAAIAGYDHLLLELLDLYKGDSTNKIIFEVCKSIVLDAKLPMEEAIYFLNKLLRKYFTQLDCKWITAEFDKLDEEHRSDDFRLGDIWVNVAQFNGKQDELEPAARCLVQLCQLVETSLVAGRAIDLTKLKEIIITVQLTAKGDRYKLFQSMLIYLHGALLDGSENNIKRERLINVIKIAAQLIVEVSDCVLEDNRLVFSNFAFACGEYGLAYDLAPKSPLDNLHKLANPVCKMIMLFFAELKIRLPEDVLSFYCANQWWINRDNFVVTVALPFVPDDLKVANISVASIKKLREKLGELRAQLVAFKFNLPQALPLKEKSKQLDYMLDLALQRIKLFEKQTVNASEAIDVSKLGSKELERLKLSCDIIIDSLAIFRSLVESFNAKFSKDIFTIKLLDENFDKLEKNVLSRGKALAQEQLARQFADELKQPGIKAKGKAEQKDHGDKNPGKGKDPAKEKNNDEDDIAPTSPVQLPPLVMHRTGKISRLKPTIPEIPPYKSKNEPARSPGAPSVPQKAPTPKKIVPQLSPPIRTTPAAPTLFIQPMVLVPVLPPFNKVPPAIIKLLFIIDNFAAQKGVTKFANFPVPVYALLFGGMVRDCFMLEKVSGDADILVRLTGEQLMQLFKDAKPRGEGRTYRLEFEGIPVDLKPIGADALVATLSQLDFPANAMAYHPKAGLIDLDGRGQSNINQRILDFIKYDLDIFRTYPERILRAMRFAVKYGWDHSTRMLGLIAILTESNEMQDLMMLIQEEKLKEEYRKLIEAYDGDVDMAHDALINWGMYSAFVARGIIQHQSSPKLKS